MLPWILLVGTYVVVLNLGVAAMQIWLLRRRRIAPRWVELAIMSWAIVMSVLFLLQGVEPSGAKAFLREEFYLPMAVEMVWNVLLLQVLAPAMILAVLVARWMATRSLPTPEPAGISRRRFLYLLGVGAMPATAIGMGVHGALTSDDLRLREFTIAIPNLPPEFEGFTIAHVSDLHSGLFVGPRRLKHIADMTNDLKADLIAITGDIINREMGEFPAALAAIQRMESAYGLCICEGNHDDIPGPRILVNACRENGLPVIFDSCGALRIRGGRLLLGGLSWNACREMNIYPTMVRDLFPPREDKDVRILLAHHPHVFDIAQDADLVLSGHTHGGQIMFGDVGLGRLRFKYCSGLFHRGNTTMIVNNGCGDWFPCRIGAPAEIGLLRLTKAKLA